MKNFIVIKAQDRGGSYFIKNELLPKFNARKNYIFDVNQEYKKFKNEAGHIWEKEEFLKTVPCETNSKVNVIFEEASAFFSKNGGTSKDTIKHICRRYHSKNINVFVFHALDQVPTDILYYIDFIVLFRTQDNPLKIQKTFAGWPKIIKAFEKVQRLTEGTQFDRERKTYPNEHSKKFFHHKEIIAAPFN